MTAAYHDLVQHYEACLARHGDSHQGVDWPNAADAQRRYEVMLDVIRPNAPRPVRLLDFGCGAGHLYEHLRHAQRDDIAYAGLDLSPRFVALCRAKHPGVEFYCLDLLKDDARLPEFDYLVLNGVFTEKREMPSEAMWEYFEELLVRAFGKARAGIAFNVMSDHVDWRRDDLFHVPHDRLAALLVRRLSRHFVFRNDYGLYEYTTYVYRARAEWPMS
jgi:SAM-dependent methyltransferase